MKRHSSFIVTVVAILISMSPLPSIQAGEKVYGWQLMTEQERTEHREKMQSFKTEQEREQYRKEHHKKMEKRAKQQGVTLPDRPMPRGKGMGAGEGRGDGPGGGKGR